MIFVVSQDVVVPGEGWCPKDGSLWWRLKRRRSKSRIERRAARALRCRMENCPQDDKPSRGAELARGIREILPNLARSVAHGCEPRSTHACVSGPRIVCTNVEEFEAG